MQTMQICFADTCTGAELLVLVLYIAAKEIELCINNKKTECMLLNHTGIVKSLNGNTIKQVENFSYLGSEISSTAKDVSSRIGKVWIALNILYTIWKSTANLRQKKNFFRATVETVLIYESVT